MHAPKITAPLDVAKSRVTGHYYWNYKLILLKFSQKHHVYVIYYVYAQVLSFHATNTATNKLWKTMLLTE